MNFFITGTDTDIGKTVLSLFLMKKLINYNQKRCHYFKPFQTGKNTTLQSDADFIKQNLLSNSSDKNLVSTLYHFDAPLAPYFSGKREGKKISEKDFDQKISELLISYDHLVIEGSGGIFVPITKKKLLLDFIRRIPKIRALVAIRCGLGTINHTLMTIDGLRKYNIPIDGIFMINKENYDLNLMKNDIQENIKAIEEFSSLPVLGVLPYIKHFNQEFISKIDIESLFLKNFLD